MYRSTNAMRVKPNRLYKEQVIGRDPNAQAIKMPDNTWAVFGTRTKEQPNKNNVLGTGLSATAAWRNAYVGLQARNITRRYADSEARRIEGDRKRRALRRERIGAVAAADLAKMVLAHVAEAEDRGTNAKRMLALHRIRQLCEAARDAAETNK